MSELGKGAPVITEMLVIPVAGEDSMLLNLSGAHGPLFTRNIVILKDNAGHTGVGEVPGGEPIRQTLEEAKRLLVGRSIASYNAVLNAMRERFSGRDAGGRGQQTFDLTTAVHSLPRAPGGPRLSGRRSRHARSARAVSRRSPVRAPGRMPAAHRRADAGLSVLHRRPQQDTAAVSPFRQRERRLVPAARRGGVDPG